MSKKLIGRGIYVDTDEVRRQAKTLNEAPDRLITAIRRFSPSAPLPDHALGSLPQAVAPLSQYRTAVNDMLANAETLIGVNVKGSDNLKVSAHNYERADQP